MLSIRFSVQAVALLKAKPTFIFDQVLYEMIWGNPEASQGLGDSDSRFGVDYADSLLYPLLPLVGIIPCFTPFVSLELHPLTTGVS
jgi:hypothetical protein